MIQNGYYLEARLRVAEFKGKTPITYAPLSGSLALVPDDAIAF
jgi:hypothetical protein